MLACSSFSPASTSQAGRMPCCWLQATDSAPPSAQTRNDATSHRDARAEFIRHLALPILARMASLCKPMQQIAIFTTGGTIDKVYFDAKGGYEVGGPVVRQVLEHARAGAAIPVVELLRKDSLEMTARTAKQSARPWPPRAGRGSSSRTAPTRWSRRRVRCRTCPPRPSCSPARCNRVASATATRRSISAWRSRPCSCCRPACISPANGRVFDAQRVRKNLAANRFEDAEP